MSFYCRLLFQASFLWVVLSSVGPKGLKAVTKLSIVISRLEIACCLISKPHQIIRYVSHTVSHEQVQRGNVLL